MSSKSVQQIQRNREQTELLTNFGLSQSRDVRMNELLSNLFPILNDTRHYLPRFNYKLGRFKTDAATELKFNFATHLSNRWNNIFDNFTPEVDRDDDETFELSNYRAGSFVIVLEKAIATKSYRSILQRLDRLRDTRPLAFELNYSKYGKLSEANHLNRELLMISQNLLRLANLALDTSQILNDKTKILYSLSIKENDTGLGSVNEYFESFESKFNTTDQRFYNWSTICITTKHSFSVEHRHGDSKCGYTTTSSIDDLIMKELTVCGINHKDTTYRISTPKDELDQQALIYKLTPTWNRVSNRDYSFNISKEMFIGSHTQANFIDDNEDQTYAIKIRKECTSQFIRKLNRCATHNFPTSGYAINEYNTFDIRRRDTIVLINNTIDHIGVFFRQDCNEQLNIKLRELREIKIPKRI